MKLLGPKEQYWGRLIDISAAGIQIRGFEVSQIEKLRFQLGKPDRDLFPQTLFIPMGRVLEVAQDETRGPVPAVIDTLRGYASDDEILLD